MADYVTRVRTDKGDKQIDYNALANLPDLATQFNAKQNTITGGATTIANSNLTSSRALISNSSGKVAVSAVTSTELGYLDGVTSNIQNQFDTIKDGALMPDEYTTNIDLYKLGDAVSNVSYTAPYGTPLNVTFKNLWYNPSNDTFYGWTYSYVSAGSNLYNITVMVYSTKDNVTWNGPLTNTINSCYGTLVDMVLTDSGVMILGVGGSNYNNKIFYYSNNFGSSFTKGGTITSSRISYTQNEFYRVQGGAIYKGYVDSSRSYFYKFTSDGKTFVDIVPPSDAGSPVEQICKFKSTYILVANSSVGKAYYSSNGTNWTEITASGTGAQSSPGSYRRALVTKNFAMVLWSTYKSSDYNHYCDKYSYTTNGTTWTNRSSPNGNINSNFNKSFNSEGYNEAALIITTSDKSSSGTVANYYSLNGVNWTPVYNQAASNFADGSYNANAVYYGSGKFQLLKSGVAASDSSSSCTHVLHTSQASSYSIPHNPINKASGVKLNSLYRHKSYIGNGSNTLTLTLETSASLLLISSSFISSTNPNSRRTPLITLVTPTSFACLDNSLSSLASYRGNVQVSNEGKTWQLNTSVYGASMCQYGTDAFNQSGFVYHVYYL